MFFFAVTELSGHGVRSSRLTFNQGFHMSDFFLRVFRDSIQPQRMAKMTIRLGLFRTHDGVS